MGMFSKLYRKLQNRTCKRCGSQIFSTKQFFDKCEEEGLKVDRNSGQVSGKVGGFAAPGYQAFDYLDTQYQSQKNVYQMLENQRGFKCSSCGAKYCLDCLFQYASTHSEGGKACPNCGGRFNKL